MTKDGFEIIKKRYVDEHQQISIMLKELKSNMAKEKIEIEKTKSEINSVNAEIKKLVTTLNNI